MVRISDTLKGACSMINILEYITSSLLLGLFILVALAVARIYGASTKISKLLEEIRDKLE